MTEFTLDELTKDLYELAGEFEKEISGESVLQPGDIIKSMHIMMMMMAFLARRVATMEGRS